jgi:hypothetical protein
VFGAESTKQPKQPSEAKSIKEHATEDDKKPKPSPDKLIREGHPDWDDEMVALAVACAQFWKIEPLPSFNRALAYSHVSLDDHVSLKALLTMWYFSSDAMLLAQPARAKNLTMTDVLQMVSTRLNEQLTLKTERKAAKSAITSVLTDLNS